MYNFHQLLAQANRIALRDKYDTVERIGDQEDRQGIGVLQFHRCSHLLLDRPVDIQTVCDRAR